MTTDKKPKKPEPKASITIKEFLGVPKKAPLLVDVEVPPALAAVIPREPKEPKPPVVAPLPIAHVTAARASESPPDLRAKLVCACCGNPKSGGVACVVCGN